MSHKKIIIIGGGIAGLAAGCYGQMNGYDTEIFELHDLPGGLCTSWERKGYLFDGCIHYLFGTAPGQPFHDIWQELGALDGCDIVNHEMLMRIVGRDGERFDVYADPDRLQAHMTELSPADADHIAAFAAGVRQFMDFDMSMLQARPRAIMNGLEWRDFGLSVLPYAVPLAKWGTTSAREFAARFKSPFLREAIPLMFGWADIPVMVGMSVLAYMHLGNAGFPAGGSLAVAQRIARRYEALGGKIHYGHQVEKILIDDDRAVGVRLYNDDCHYADYVVSAADGRGTIFELLDGRYVDRGIAKTYDGRLTIHSQVQVSLGIDRDLSSEPYWVNYLLPEPRLIAGKEQAAIGFKQYAFDPSMAPAGKTPLIVALESPYAYWQRIYGRRLYDMEQLQVADLVLDFLEERFPGIAAAVEVKDVATPLSYERYTGNWKGATCGWLLTDKMMMTLVQGMPKTLPGLQNFYMAGQWVEPGGSVPVVAMSGRNAIQLICHQEEQAFAAAPV